MQIVKEMARARGAWRRFRVSTSTTETDVSMLLRPRVRSARGTSSSTRICWTSLTKTHLKVVSFLADHAVGFRRVEAIKQTEEKGWNVHGKML
nr:hypothetical protein [Actinomyces sp.]